VKPKVLARFNERPRVVVLPDNNMFGLYVNREGRQQELRAIPSEDS